MIYLIFLFILFLDAIVSVNAKKKQLDKLIREHLKRAPRAILKAKTREEDNKMLDME